MTTTTTTTMMTGVMTPTTWRRTTTTTRTWRTTLRQKMTMTRASGGAKDDETASGVTIHNDARRVGGVMATMTATVAMTPAAAFAADNALSGAWASFTHAFATPEAKELFMYTLKTLISWGVPSVTVAVALFFAISASRRGARMGGDKPSGPFGFIKGGANGAKPRTEPYLEIKRMNDKLDDYGLSFEAATVSELQAERSRKSMEFSKKFSAALGQLSEDECQAILNANKKWQMTDARLASQMNQILAQMRATSIEMGGKRGKKDASDDESAANASSDESKDDEESSSFLDGLKSVFASDKNAGLSKKLAKLTQSRASAENQYLQAVSAALPKSRRESLIKLLANPRELAGWQNNTDILAFDPENDENSKLKKKHVFVLNFFGDVRASQAEQLREEVTGLLRSAKKERGDEVVLRLNTGGGTVTGYGLAAAQLMRIKDAGLKLTICVEQVAASGGYMMACVADEIVASPFAVLGSIGVISEQPNVYERLKTEGIEFQTVTAGKFKRTLTPTKKVNKEDLEKSKKDIEAVLVLFKGFVEQNRPSLDIDNVATGETWFGNDALQRNLVDKLKTSDDVLLDLLGAGAEIFSIQLKQPSKAQSLFAGAGANASWQWDLLQRVALGVADYAKTSSGMNNVRAPMMIDRAADNVIAYDDEYDYVERM